MRHNGILTLCLAGTVALSACEKPADTDVERTMDSLNVLDESNLGDLMLTSASPDEAVSYFRRSVDEHPERIDLQRGLAVSLTRARKPAEAVTVWKKVQTLSGSTAADQVSLASAHIRNGDWDNAEITLDSVPPTHETYDRYRLEAMVADSNQEWSNADSYYATAVGLTTTPAGVLNNWGFSKLTRGEYANAEKLFANALEYNSSLFTAKNNLVLARGAQRKYDIPIIPMSQTERALLLHTLALSAIKQGDVSTGQGLLKDAIETHPQYFETAVRSLDALESSTVN